MVKKILVVGLVFVSFGLAQGKKGGGGGGNMGGAPMGMARPSKLDMIATTLELDKDQKKNVKTILDDGAKEASPLRDKISKSRVAVGEAMLAKKGDEDLKQVARNSSDAEVQLTRLELDTFAKVVGTLNEAQKKNTPALGRVLMLMNDIYHTKNWNEE